MDSTTLDPRREQGATAGPVDPPPPGDRFVGISLLVLVAGFLVLQVVAGAVIPEVAIPSALYAALAVALLRRRRRWLLITAVVLPVVHLVGSVPFLAASLSSPETPASFIPDAITVVAAVTTVVGAVMALRHGEDSRRGVAVAAVGLAGVVVVASLVVAAGVESAQRRDGDVAIEAIDVAFPERVEVPVGPGTLWVDNRDPIHHTIVIEDTGVRHDLPGRTAVRVPVDLEPGAYRYFCDVPGHDGMEGELIVAP